MNDAIWRIFNNCLFSVVFGVLKATAGSTDWEAVSTGNKIQVFAQILYGYGYWGPFALEYETSRVDCGLSDLERTLYEYGYVTDYNRSDLDPTIGKYFTSELNSAIKENLYCLVSITQWGKITFFVHWLDFDIWKNVTFVKNDILEMRFLWKFGF